MILVQNGILPFCRTQRGFSTFPFRQIQKNRHVGGSFRILVGGIHSAHPCASPFGRALRVQNGVLPFCRTQRGFSTFPFRQIQKNRHVGGSFVFGGEGGIRTPGRFDPSPDFKSGAFNRTLPPLQWVRILKSNQKNVKCKYQKIVKILLCSHIFPTCIRK